ncbi:MAG TPA: replication-associated recombination protein A [Candidatus Acidoferrales bacterium]|nr:replication-associated recombination protein A [Candidatus Acidoferrales bacterium]
MSLFRQLDPEEEPGERAEGNAPLAERMRPRTLDDVVGQEHLLGPGAPLRAQIEAGRVQSMILWGPPGCGKTTLGRLIAGRARADFVPFSAVLSGIKEIREVMTQAARAGRAGRRTIVFIDEVHRFNKAQQDAFLPFVEQGSITLIGATTENPSFEVIAPLLSRARVYRLEALSNEQIVALLRRALADGERGLGAMPAEVRGDLLERIAVFSAGDARAAYNILEAAVAAAPPDAAGRREITQELLERTLQRKTLLYDKSGEEHFNLISALHKSVRNSDADASLYWLARMLESGEDPMYLARRMVRMASEDIGLADPQALRVTLDAMNAYDFLGAPEGHLALAEAAVYLALAPKSNALYKAYGAVAGDLAETRAEPVPLHLRNAVTGLMKAEGYGRGYQYAHDYDDKVTDMECLPESLRGRRYYHPTDQGVEARIRQRMEEIARLKAKPKS